MYNHVSVTLNGLASIRASGTQQMYLNQFYIYQDDLSATRFLSSSTSQALGFAIDLLCLLYLIAVCFVLVIYSERISGGSAGLALSSGNCY